VRISIFFVFPPSSYRYIEGMKLRHVKLLTQELGGVKGGGVGFNEDVAEQLQDAVEKCG